METAVSELLSELPSFLSTISMVVDEPGAIIKELIRAERKSPPRYGPAKDLFRHLLQGDLSLDNALVQASKIQDPIQQLCAIKVLTASASYLRGQTPSPIRYFPRLNYQLPNGMDLNVSPLWIRYTEPERLMILHTWVKPLTPRQLGAAAAILRLTLQRHRPEHVQSDLDFISVSVPENREEREFEC